MVYNVCEWDTSTGRLKVPFPVTSNIYIEQHFWKDKIIPKQPINVKCLRLQAIDL